MWSIENNMYELCNLRLDYASIELENAQYVQKFRPTRVESYTCMIWPALQSKIAFMMVGEGLVKTYTDILWGSRRFINPI